MGREEMVKRDWEFRAEKLEEAQLYFNVVNAKKLVLEGEAALRVFKDRKKGVTVEPKEVEEDEPREPAK